MKRLSLLGSVQRDDFTPESDVDVLIEFEPGTRIGYFGLQGLEDEFAEMVGRKVRMTTPGAYSRYRYDEVLLEARILHVAA